MSVAISFPHELSGHCASGAFRDLFEFRGYRHNGHPLSEAMVFGLGAGLDLMYMPQPASRIPFYLGGRSPMLEESLIARIGGSMFRRSEPDNDSAWSWARQRLDAGEPVPMVADCQKLEYLKTRASMPLHVIVATGYDATHALIADNDRAEIQRCSLESLRSARSAVGFPLPAMNVTFEIDWPAEIPPLERLVLPAIREIVGWMHEPSGAPAAIFGKESFGLNAIDALARDAALWERSPPSGGPQLLATLLWIAIEKGGTGGGFFRRLFRDFLAEVLALSPSSALARAHAHYEMLATEWTALGQQCGAGSFAGAAERLVMLAKAEREGVTLLEQVAGA